jgi:sulfur carrier protein
VSARQVTVSVNGESRNLHAGGTVSDLLQTANLDPALVLVELNETVLQRREYPLTVLRAGDRIEFIRVVAGG